MEARIIRLEDPNVFDQAVTFEEAFGVYSQLSDDEYSEVIGKKARARRKARRLERITNRKEVKKARISARDEVKRDRQDSRLSRRQDRKGKRQEIRAGQQEARMSRRGRRLQMREDRAQSRQNRKNIKSLGEQQRQNYEAEQDQYRETLAPQTEDQGYGQQDQGYLPETLEQGQQPQGGGMAYNTYDEEPYQEPMYSDQPSEESTGEGEYNQDGDYVGEESGYLADYDASGDNFDGVLEGQDGFSDADGIAPVDPQVQTAVDKLAWNTECIKRLKRKRKTNPNQGQAISKRIIEHQKRANELKSGIDSYLNFDDYEEFDNYEEFDDYSDANAVSQKRTIKKGGRKKNALGLEDRKREKARRKKMCERAWRISQGKIKNASNNPVVAPITTTTAGNVIPVAANLNPAFSPDKIVVPNQMVSSVTGNTGLTGIDLQDDFDAPNAREIFIGADGSKTKVSWGSVLIGVGVGVAAVWAIKKYNLLK